MRNWLDFVMIFVLAFVIIFHSSAFASMYPDTLEGGDLIYVKGHMGGGNLCS